MNQIQKLFIEHGFDLQNDTKAAELCEAIIKRIRNKASTQPEFLDGNKFKSIKDRVHDLKTRILTEE